MKVIIIGGGVAGLATALFMKKIGFDPVIYEAYPKVTKVGNGFQIAPNGMRVLSALGLEEAIVERGTIATGMRFYNYKGKLLAQTEHQKQEIYGHPAVNVSRGSLMDVLITACERAGINIHYEKKLVRIEKMDDPQPVAIFEDKTSATGDLIVGADGLHSRVRNVIFPDAPLPQDTGLLSFGGFVDPSVLTTLPPPRELMMTFGKVGFFGYCLCSSQNDSEKIMWWSTIPNPGLTKDALANMPIEDARALMLQVHKGWREPTEIIIKNFSHTINGLIYDIAHLPSWTKNRVVLIGDAAHAVTPHSGQGVSLALEDAMSLASLFLKNIKFQSPLPVEKVCQQFQMARKERAEEIVKEGRRSAPMKAELNDAFAWMRDKFVHYMLPGIITSSTRKLYEYQIDWPEDHKRQLHTMSLTTGVVTDMLSASSSSSASVPTKAPEVLLMFKSTTNSQPIQALQAFFEAKSKEGVWDVRREDNHLVIQFISSTDANSTEPITTVKGLLSQLPEWHENVKEGKLQEGGLLRIECKASVHAEAYEGALKSVFNIDPSQDAKSFFKKSCISS